jgi:hypothetical protein
MTGTREVTDQQGSPSQIEIKSERHLPCSPTVWGCDLKRY